MFINKMFINSPCDNVMTYIECIVASYLHLAFTI